MSSKAYAKDSEVGAVTHWHSEPGNLPALTTQNYPSSLYSAIIKVHTNIVEENSCTDMFGSIVFLQSCPWSMQTLIFPQN